MKLKWPTSEIVLAATVLVILFATFSISRPLSCTTKPTRKKSVEALTESASNRQLSPTNNRYSPTGKIHPTVANIVAVIPPGGANSKNNTLSSVDVHISATTLRQIAALEAEKMKRTTVQQKIDSQLLYADKMSRGMPVAEGLPTQRVDLEKDDQGRIIVDIQADVTKDLLNYIETWGGKIINSFPQYDAIRADVPLASIENLAARSEVRFVKPAVRAMNNTVDSQGDYTHQANTARTTFSVIGAGVKVGVLSDSVDNLNSSQIAGKVTVLSGQSGIPATGEGTAMLEIVNDLAPGAQLYFATADGGEANFANNIQQLSAAGCKIIVDDVSYYDESPFQDAIVAKAVNTVTANGVLYFSSAGNSGNKDDGTSGTWEGDFSDGGQSQSPLEGGRLHNFGGGVNANAILGSGPGGNQLRADLFWSDPLGASTNDYDLYVINSSGDVVAHSLNTQNGSQDPYESVPTVVAGEYLVIVKFAGAGRFLHLSTGRGELSLNTQGSSRGHACATNAFCVAATDANNSYPSAFTGGAGNPVETFSSDGPRRVFFQANGTPITPGNFSSSGGAVRQKPDITAADKIATDVPGFPSFAGTSAAAPHAGAIAALLKSYNTNLTQSQILAILTNTALDIMSPGVDRDSGSGIVMALAALQASPPPDLTKFTDNLDNSSPYAGDTLNVSLTITNQPCTAGSASAGAFHVGWYFSSSSSFAGATPFHETPLNGCDANGTVLLSQSILINSQTAPGTYFLGYKIDDENEVGECDENNNGIFYWMITVMTTNISVTVQPNPSGLSFTVDGTNYTTSQTFNWMSGASHTIAASFLQNGGSGIQYVWNSWSDGGQISHTVTPTTGTNYIANFTTQYYLTMTAGMGGAISPASGWFNSETVIPISATANNGYSFDSLTGTGSGSYTGSSSSTSVTMKGPISETANFTVNPGNISVTVQTSPAGRSFTVDGANYTTTQTFGWVSGSGHAIVTSSPQSGGTGIQYIWSDWSDARPISHTVAPASDTTYTANFSKQYRLDTGVSPAGGGTITANPSGSWLSPGQAVQLTANAASGNSFSSWTGVDSSSANTAIVSMNGYRNVTASFTASTSSISFAFVTIAGSTNVGGANGIGSAAQFNYPLGVAADNAGNIYVADTYNDTIRKITPNGKVATFVGSAGNLGNANGTGSAARFFWPSGVAVDNVNNVYVADTHNDTIRKITPGGSVTTLAGSPQSPGSADGVSNIARFYQPNGVAVGTDGSLYVADTGNNTIRLVTPLGFVSTLAGSPGNSGSVDGTGTNALFNAPSGIAADNSGNVYVADTGNNVIRLISPGGIVTTLAGLAGNSGRADGSGTNATFNEPVSVAVDKAGSVFVADEFNYLIRKIASNGAVSTVAGLAGHYGNADGTGTNVLFGLPSSVAIDGAGNVYVADTDNNTIRKGSAVGTLPVFVLEVPLVMNNQVKFDFTVTIGTASNFTLLQSSQLTGPWSPNVSAVLTTNVPGVSYSFMAMQSTNSSKFYRVRSP